MTTDTVGGVWTYACELIAALAPFDVHVTLATMGAPLTPSQARTASALSNAEVIESRFALEWMPDPWPDVDAAGDWLLELAHRVRPDIVHVNGYAHAALPFGVPVICVAHSCVLSWFRAVHATDAGAEWNEYRRRTGRGLRSADTIVAPTAAILRTILDAHGMPPCGRVIPNGRARTAWSPKPKEPFVLSAGRLWDEAKGLADLDACAERVSWPIHVAGPTKGPGGIADITPRGVHLLGELAPAELADWMGRASIYALPARYEPFGLSVLEAALSGCALVVGDLDTLREIWGPTVVYVPAGDLDALAFSLAVLVRDPLRRGGLAASARARAMAMTPQRMALAYHALYAERTAPFRQELSA